MLKNQKGITLIALVITIIVLLILAGVTIAMLTGSDSAPVKANEAKQKQDIGAAKDQVYIVSSALQTTAYEKVYVDGKNPNTSTETDVTADTAAGAVGTYVANNITDTTKGGIANNSKVQDATIVFSDSAPDTTKTTATINDIPSDDEVSKYVRIYTTDFQTFGWITAESGVLNWTTAGIVDLTE